jgi:hypothetical protein
MVNNDGLVKSAAAMIPDSHLGAGRQDFIHDFIGTNLYREIFEMTRSPTPTRVGE